MPYQSELERILGSLSSDFSSARKQARVNAAKPKPKKDPIAAALDPALVGPLGPDGPAAKFGALRRGKVIRVVDGDTVVVQIGKKTEKVRLIGVNTPESTTKVQPGGHQASAYTSAQLDGQDVWLEGDHGAKDSYGRTLSYVYTSKPKQDQGSTEARLARYNSRLAEIGYASPMAIAPNTKYAAETAGLGKTAKEHGYGFDTASAPAGTGSWQERSDAAIAKLGGRSAGGGSVSGPPTSSTSADEIAAYGGEGAKRQAENVEGRQMGWLQKALAGLSTLGVIVRSAIRPDQIKKSSERAAHADSSSLESTFAGVRNIDENLRTLWRTGKDPTSFGNGRHGIGGFLSGTLLDMATDPSTFLGGTGAAKSAGKEIAAKALQVGAESMGREGVELGAKAAAQVVKDAAKAGGMSRKVAAVAADKMASQLKVIAAKKGAAYVERAGGLLRDAADSKLRTVVAMRRLEKEMPDIAEALPKFLKGGKALQAPLPKILKRALPFDVNPIYRSGGAFTGITEGLGKVAAAGTEAAKVADTAGKFGSGLLEHASPVLKKAVDIAQHSFVRTKYVQRLRDLVEQTGIPGAVGRAMDSLRQSRQTQRVVQRHVTESVGVALRLERKLGKLGQVLEDDLRSNGVAGAAERISAGRLSSKEVEAFQAAIDYMGPKILSESHTYGSDVNYLEAHVAHVIASKPMKDLVRLAQGDKALAQRIVKSGGEVSKEDLEKIASNAGSFAKSAFGKFREHRGTISEVNEMMSKVYGKPVFTDRLSDIWGIYGGSMARSIGRSHMLQMLEEAGIAKIPALKALIHDMPDVGGGAAKEVAGVVGRELHDIANDTAVKVTSLTRHADDGEVWVTVAGHDVAVPLKSLVEAVDPHEINMKEVESLMSELPADAHQEVEDLLAGGLSDGAESAAPDSVAKVEEISRAVADKAGRVAAAKVKRIEDQLLGEGYQIVRRMKDGNVLVPPAIDDWLKNEVDAFHPKGRALRAYDAVQGWWKVSALGTPGWVSRNLQGIFWQNTIAGVELGDWKYALSTLAHNFGAKARAKAFEAGELSPELYAAIRRGAVDSDSIGGEAIYASSVAGSKLKALFQAANPLGKNFVVMQGIRPAQQAVENFGRLAAFHTAVRKGMSYADATEWVAIHHFVYDELTHMEREIGKRLLPFYTFQSRNFKLQVEALLTHPDMFRNLGIAQRNAEEVAGRNARDERLSDRSVSMPSFPIGKDKYLIPDMPYQGLNMLPSKLPGNGFLESMGLRDVLSPLIRGAAEQVGGYSRFGGKSMRPLPQWADTPGIRQALATAGVAVKTPTGYLADSAKLRAIEDMFPALSRFSRAAPGQEDSEGQSKKFFSIASMILGSPIRKVTPQEQARVQKQIDKRLKDILSKAMLESGATQAKVG